MREYGYISKPGYILEALIEVSKLPIQKLDGNGAYLFLLSGKILVNNLELNSRDAIGITDTENIVIQILESSRILMIDVPMQL